MVAIHDDIKREMIYIAAILILEIVLIKLLFSKESVVTVIKLSLSLFWLFLLPGFMIMYLFSDNMDFLERIIAGFVLGMAFFGVIGYNLGVLGMLIKYQIWVLPIIGIIIGIIALIKNKKIIL